LQDLIIQAREKIGSWGEQISDAHCQAESAARIPPIVGVCVRFQSWADGDDGDSDGDVVIDSNYST
jgi:hypothetical protein